MKTAASMVVDKGVGTKEVARELRIPYTTVTDWVKRYRQGGEPALRPRKREQPKGRATSTDPRREAVLEVKRSQPQAGSRRIRDVVRRFFGIGTSETTVRRVLKEEGLAKAEPSKPKPRPRPKVQRFERAEPNQLWQSDLFT